MERKSNKGKFQRLSLPSDIAIKGDVLCILMCAVSLLPPIFWVCLKRTLLLNLYLLAGESKSLEKRRSCRALLQMIYPHWVTSDTQKSECTSVTPAPIWIIIAIGRNKRKLSTLIASRLETKTQPPARALCVGLIYCYPPAASFINLRAPEKKKMLAAWFYLWSTLIQ